MEAGMSRVSVVVPTLNEEKNVSWVLERIPRSFEVVLVDGRSTDGTVETARAVRLDVKVVLEPQPGKGAALRAGFEAASGHFIIAIDADGSMDPLELPRYVAMLEMGYDMVKGSRYSEGGGSEDLTLIRSVGNRFLMGVANIIYRSRFSDFCYGYFGLRRECIASLDLTATGFEIEAEIILRSKRADLKIVEVPTYELARMNGSGNLNAVRDGLRILRTILKESRWQPLGPVPTVDIRTDELVVDLRDDIVIDIRTPEVEVVGGAAPSPPTPTPSLAVDR